ncbi:MAG: PRC-barrel domain-containing protein [SAR324 cluster bacterium]|nr:PRC-barrel domain-containing protein [SAR324 cluster bacterium]
MLKSAIEIIGYSLKAKDGEIGQCKDFLFDDEFWTVRYMVAKTGKWLLEQDVLISTKSLDKPDWKRQIFPIHLSKSQINKAPGIETDKPVSKQFEAVNDQKFEWPFYWGSSYGLGTLLCPALSNEGIPSEHQINKQNGDEHLRSIHEVTGYQVTGTDGEVGLVSDFVVDVETWAIWYMIVNTGNWLKKNTVLISQASVDSIDWLEKRVSVKLSGEQVQNCPQYDSSILVNNQEGQQYDFYGRPYSMNENKNYGPFDVEKVKILKNIRENINHFTELSHIMLIDAQKRMKADLSVLEKKWESASESLNSLNNTKKDAWQEVAAGFEEAWEDLGKHFQKAIQRLKQEGSSFEENWEVYQDASKKWRWRYFDPEKQIIGSSYKGFETQELCIEDARRYGFEASELTTPV